MGSAGQTLEKTLVNMTSVCVKGTKSLLIVGRFANVVEPSLRLVTGVGFDDPLTGTVG